MFSQVNTEIMRPDLSKSGIHSNSQFNFGLSSGNVEYGQVGISSRLDMIGEKHYSFVIGNLNYREARENVVARSGFIHLRTSFLRINNFSTESFVQSEFNSFTLLESRFLLGSNARYKFNLDSNNSIAFGSGLFFEKETLEEEIRYISDKWRWNNYLNIQLKINNVLKFVSSSYFQVDIFAISDFRMLNESNLEFAISKNLQFIFSLVYRYDEEPPKGVIHYDLVVSNGIRIKF